MKKTLLLFFGAASILAAGKTFAQSDSTTTVGTYSSGKMITPSRFSWGVRAGVNFTNINGKYSGGNKMKNDLLVGWNAGVNVEIPIAPEFYFQPGVLFTTAGAKLDNVALNQAYNTTVHLSYVEIPLNFVYKPMLGAGHLIAGLGPYIDFGVGGKVKYSGNGAPADRDIKWQNTVNSSDNGNYAYYRGFGAGGNLLFGYEFANRLSLQLNAQLGLTDINPDYGSASSHQKATKTGFGISAGYRF